jgi:hypothetical protein
MSRYSVLTAVVACALTVACSGPDVDIGNGPSAEPGAGSSGTTGTSASGTTTGSDHSGTTVAAVTGTTSGTVGSTGTGGSAGAGGSGAGGGPIISGTASAIVIRQGDIPGPNPSTGSTATGGALIDPDTPYVFLGNGPPTCADPGAGPACGFWQVTIGIPRALFQRGVLSLGDPRLVSVDAVRGPDDGTGLCAAGGSTFTAGTLEIVDVGSSTVTLRLANTMKVDFDADGMHAATNCP